MTRRSLLAVAFALMTLASVDPVFAARPQESEDRGSDLLIRIKGPLAVEAGDTVGSAWVFGNDARVTGTVRDQVFVVDGIARIEGSVRGVTIVNGHLELGPTARVAEDVLLYRSTVSRSSGAFVGGKLHHELGPSFSASALWILWVSVTLALIVVGLVVARLGAPTVEEASRFPASTPGATVLTAAAVIVGLPAAAVLAFMSGLGFVLGIIILLFVIPALAFAGYFVSALAMGRALFGIPERRSRSVYAHIATGVLALQLLALIPVVGALVTIVASQIGAGGLVYRTWRQQRTSHRPPLTSPLPA